MLAAVLGLAYGGVMPLYSVLAREYFPPRLLGTVLGAATMTSSIGMAFGPLGGGWLYDTYGTYHWLYIASAGSRHRRRRHGAGLPAGEEGCRRSARPVAARLTIILTSPVTRFR